MTPLAPSPAATDGPVRVMVVDDSAVIRGLLTLALESDPGVVIVASAANGQMALHALEHYAVDVAVLDIDMPVMDGLTALPRMIAHDPTLKVVIASTMTRRNAEISLRALELGASDYLTKPSSGGQLNSAEEFKRQLLEKVKALGAARRRARGEAGPASAETGRAGHGARYPAPGSGDIVLRPWNSLALRPEILAVGCSTGGPQALFRVLKDLGTDWGTPILVTQHMPATFTAILAEHAARATGLPCVEAADGVAARSGQVYIAPGDFHLTVEVRDGQGLLRLDRNPPENFCRPSIDPMLRSLAQAFGPRALAVILTGMGRDGLRGAEQMVSAGGHVIAQDEATSVVWGMPGAVAGAGLCSAVLPLDEIGGYLRRLSMRAAA